eukprot:COSAG03_NODE_21_length_21000_cov_26.440649_8_plen_69_part_00
MRIHTSRSRYRINGFSLKADTAGGGGAVRWRVDPASIEALLKRRIKADGFWGAQDDFEGPGDDGDYRP